MPPPEIVAGIQEILMLLVSNHILKMAVILKSIADNRKAAIIEGLHAGHSAMEIIRFFGYSKSTIYDKICGKIFGFKTVENSSISASKSYSKEREEFCNH